MHSGSRTIPDRRSPCIAPQLASASILLQYLCHLLLYCTVGDVHVGHPVAPNRWSTSDFRASSGPPDQGIGTMQHRLYLHKAGLDCLDQKLEWHLVKWTGWIKALS
eukprot:GHUV01009953.1.p1 GENE.GHUV01009953.1~~GHUV01009953.1.p1  ORF type:complete len:106 (+),score=2.19 GHUV01009953.1:732-1049(+)